MPHFAYTGQHPKTRVRLLAITPPTALCPVCEQPLGNDPRLIDLGHSERWMKAAGLGGDRLEHRRCNRGWNRGTAKKKPKTGRQIKAEVDQLEKELTQEGRVW